VSDTGIISFANLPFDIILLGLHTHENVGVRGGNKGYGIFHDRTIDLRSRVLFVFQQLSQS
jgi:hypothetical protein